MVRLNPSDARGAVYVEFLIAFMPLFVLFLGICQLSLLVVARVVVSHAAYNAARAAIVVLEDDPQYYRNVARGVVSDGGGNQQGQRMKDIRTAATEPLKILAPGADASLMPGKSVAAAITPMTLAQSSASDTFTNFATHVTLHDNTTSEAYASEPIAIDAAVTARVEYYYQCDIPLIRSLVCKSMRALMADPASRDFLSQGLRSNPTISQSITGRQLFKLTARATLPNQGAQYDHTGDTG